ncbi:DUF1684 domain-containing protein [Saccharomonospora sp. NPDC006951]
MTTTAHDTRKPETAGETSLAEWRSWHAERERELAQPYGWLSLAGLHWLDDQARTFPGIPGAWSAGNGAARVTATEDEELVVDERVLDGTTRLGIHESGSALFATFGDVRLELLRRDGRFGIRVRDPRTKVRANFSGVPSFAFDRAWVIPATFQLYSPPHVIMGTTAQPGLRHRLDVVGELRFGYSGGEYSLAATAGKGSDLTVYFGDATNGGTTGSWRTLSVPRPRSGRALLDFNRAVNPPSAFTAYGTCPCPPPGNALPFAVLAGERTPGASST